MILATLAMLAAVPAKADSIKFFSGTTGYTGPFSGAGTVYQTIQNNVTACVGGGPGNCSGNPDVVSTPQTYTSVGGQGITASAVTGVHSDLQPNFGGLGVGPDSSSPGITDQIDLGELLTIHFNSAVTLTGVATLFDNGHNPFGPGFPDNSNITGANTFLLNGVITTFNAANMALLALGPLTDFTFAAIAGQPSFYVGGLTFSAVPIPGAAWLFASGIAGIAALARRRRKNQSAIAA
jgi:hypothetical protein